MPRYFAERGKASAARSPSLARPGTYVSRREHARELGRPLARTPNPVYSSFIRDYRAFHPDIKTQREARTAWYEAHATIYAQNHGISHPTAKDIRRVRNTKEFKDAVKNLFSGDRERQMRGGTIIYGSPNRQDWRYAQSRMAA